MPWQIRPCASVSATLVMSSRRARSRRPRVLPRFTSPNSRNGGRSCRRPTSSRSDAGNPSPKGRAIAYEQAVPPSEAAKRHYAGGSCRGGFQTRPRSAFTVCEVDPSLAVRTSTQQQMTTILSQRACGTRAGLEPAPTSFATVMCFPSGVCGTLVICDCPAASRERAQSQLCQLRHYLGGKECKRAQRLRERHGAEQEIGEEIIHAELVHLALDLGAHGLGPAGNDCPVGDAGFVIGTALHAEPRGEPADPVQVAQPVEMSEMTVHRGLGEAFGFLVGIGDKDVALHPDGGTAREFGLGLRRASTLGEGLLERGD